MTQLSKPVRRETAVLYRRRPLMITLHPRHLEIREKARRDTLTVSYDVIYEFALKQRWKQEQAEKRANRKKKAR